SANGQETLFGLDWCQPEKLIVGPSPILRPATLPDSANVISSAGFSDGRTRVASQDGPTIDLSGPDHAPVSLFPLQEGDAERPMNGIYGPTFCASSVPAGPLSAWESRLRERLAKH